ncbi:MAG: fumarylacetoacetase [Acidimicrobiia bacterium]|nr:MAG: fumarylacetoacetase [Acidimicrobiia bacterium]
MTHVVPANVRSWVPVAEGSGFPIQNLPYGVFSDENGEARPGVAIGQSILDLDAVAGAGLFDTLALPAGVFSAPSLNPLLALGRPAWTAVRARVAELLDEGNDEVAGAGLTTTAIVAQRGATMHLPIEVGDFVDFYSSIHHATNVGRLFRPDAEPLLPNWRHLPVGYHGRASTVVISGTPIRRPAGQRRGPDGGPPAFGPSNALDFELEVGFVTGNANALGEPVPVDDAEQHIFGLCLVDDWSARDIQAWEYQPLGPFLGKSFATSISPWIVPLDAVAPYRVDPPHQEPAVLPYLRTNGTTGVDLRLEVEIIPDGADQGTVVSRTGFAEMYWSMAQQLAHATVTGATARAGDLFASGTVSGPGMGSRGSLLEITKNGKQPITLDDGSELTYLGDGDTVVIRGWCESEGAPIIGFGECTGRVV